MEQQRLFLFAILAALSFMIYTQWQKDYGPQPAPTQTANTQAGSGASAPGEQSMPVPTSTDKQTSSDNKAVAQVETHGQDIVVESNVYHAVIDSQGGDLRELDLKKYSVAVNKPDQPYRLLEETPQRDFVVQSGFFVANNKQLQDLTPSRQTVYQTAQTRYEITKEATNVDLVWRNREGMEFIIRYTFSPDSYHIKVSHIINNPTSNTWQGSVYLRLERTPPAEHKGLASLPTYAGPVYYSPDDKYKKEKFSAIDEANPKDGSQYDAINRQFAGGWAAMIEHYFVGAWIPPKDEVYRYFTGKLSNNRYLIGMTSPKKAVAAKSQMTTTADLFVGPKLIKALDKVAPGLDLSVDYGYMSFLSKPLFIVLSWIHGVVGNWGWSIILLTLFIKLAFYKLSETSYKSMANMRKLQPRLAAIKQRFGDDKQKYQQAMMEMYKKEKINPLGGCLPILIQIPVFIALYYMLLESVELRQADWILWIKDLSVKDPYFVLPIIMGISMFIQQRLNPTPVDPMQAKVMMFLPVVFTGLFLFFPSGLVLYWVVNNTLSIAQQWYITRVVIKEDKPKT
ncbi:MAG: membrane protein insertase YidC [Gammaproteobacteria bacterium]|nr:membrane protein insertase YidC [Gammaproteobacteria bacterium]